MIDQKDRIERLPQWRERKLIANSGMFADSSGTFAMLKFIHVNSLIEHFILMQGVPKFGRLACSKDTESTYRLHTCTEANAGARSYANQIP